MASINDFIKEWENGLDYIVAHTSGSTGTPKQIMLKKSDMIASARATNMRFGITSGSAIGCPLSVDYIAGKMMCVRAIEAGCRLVEMPVSNRLTIDSKMDLLAVVPSQVESLTAQPAAASMIKNLIIGGAPLDTKSRDRLNELGYNAYITYGMTETCSHIAISSLKDPDGIYEAMPGITFSSDQRGCLVIHAPAYSFVTLVTNDLADISDSRHFKWTGRIDNVINSGGLKISAEKIEKEIKRFYPGECCVVGCPDDKWGECAALAFEGHDDQAEEILALLRANLSHREAPKMAFAFASLPRTANGKIARNEIKGLVADMHGKTLQKR